MHTHRQPCRLPWCAWACHPCLGLGAAAAVLHSPCQHPSSEVTDPSQEMPAGAEGAKDRLPSAQGVRHFQLTHHLSGEGVTYQLQVSGAFAEGGTHQLLTQHPSAEGARGLARELLAAERDLWHVCLQRAVGVKGPPSLALEVTHQLVSHCLSSFEEVIHQLVRHHLPCGEEAKSHCLRE